MHFPVWMEKNREEFNDPPSVRVQIVFPSLFWVLGYELLFQPEVVRVYTSLLKESKNPTVLEASAGAIQNLCAGRWTVSTCY